jgi:hypothetical protein
VHDVTSEKTGALKNYFIPKKKNQRKWRKYHYEQKVIAINEREIKNQVKCDNRE